MIAEKRSVLYTQKVSITHKERVFTGGEVTSEEQKLSKHVALMNLDDQDVDRAKEINEEEQNLKAMTSSK